MTATSTLLSLKSGVDTGQFKVVVQSGGLQNGKRVARPEFPNDSDPGRPAGRQDHVRDRTAVVRDLAGRALDGQVLCTAAGNAGAVVAAYREAYRKIMDDPEFNARGLKLSEVFEPMTADDVNSLIKDIVDTPMEATDYVNSHCSASKDWAGSSPSTDGAEHVERDDAGYVPNAAAPASATGSSSLPIPDTPTPPMHSPSNRIGMPPGTPR